MGIKARSDDSGDGVTESPVHTRASETDEISAEMPLLPQGPSSDFDISLPMTASVQGSRSSLEHRVIDVKPADTLTDERETPDGEDSRKFPAVQGMQRCEEEGDADDDEPQCRICLESDGRCFKRMVTNFASKMLPYFSFFHDTFRVTLSPSIT